MGARVVVIGGGSAYMPGIAFALAHARKDFLEATVVLHDVDEEAAELQRKLSAGILRSRGAGDIHVEVQIDRLRALEGADLVLAAFRPGGLPARALDERIAVDHGVIGQETAGPGGFAMALRSVPLVVEIAGEMQDVAAPEAILLNYTNPVQIVSEAMHRFGPPVRFLGLCDQTAGEEGFIAGLLGVDAADVELDTCGTNHMTFTRAVQVDGRDVTDELWSLLDLIDLDGLDTDADRHVVRLFRMLRHIPSEYLQYFFFHDNEKNMAVTPDQVTQNYFDGKAARLSAYRIDDISGEVIGRSLFDTEMVNGTKVSQCQTDRIHPMSPGTFIVEVNLSGKEEVMVRVTMDD